MTKNHGQSCQLSITAKNPNYHAVYHHRHHHLGKLFTAGKYAYQMFDPAMAIQLRFIIASLIVLPLFLRTHRTIDKSTHNKLWAIAFLMFPIGI